MKQKPLLFLLLGVPLLATAQNPIIRDQFAADPTARVFNNKVYLYPSHDIPTPILSSTSDSTVMGGLREDWFCMADYHVFSSENLTDWHDHGVIVTQNEVPWVRPDSYSMWAPDCVFKNGKYYFFFPSTPKEGRGFAIGVATADKPEGPFVCEPEPIAGVGGIDPCVLIDDDGKAYLYWSGMGIRGARLKDSMKELDADEPRGQIMEGLPEGFKEGPFAFKQGGHYYLTFPWVRKEKGTETLAYAMSDNPLGPWQFKGIIMAEHASGCWTNHHSIVKFKDQWYLFYHHNDYSPSMDKRRSVRIERLSFNADGTIREVVPTLRGVGTTLATARIDVDRYSTASDGVTICFIDSLLPFRGWELALAKKGAWATYDNVDFSPLHAKSYVTATVKATENTSLVIREKSRSGKVIARFPIRVVSDGQYRRDMRGQWITVTAPLEYIPSGISALCLVSEGAEVSIDWLQFKNHEQYFRPASAETARPDAEGFIRRWLVLDPIDKPNPTNAVFTDSYLQEALAPSPFVETVPKDGQKVKVGRQTLTWHALDSERFNLKLFRFAEAFQKPVYGVLFWTVTEIICSEDIPDVRLAVGSNSASRWWLNGEEALLLSGDRRMVKDDMLSPRLTLKKGRNVLRGAIINGPGMSDFCVRFVDEKGNPVNNFEIK